MRQLTVAFLAIAVLSLVGCGGPAKIKTIPMQPAAIPTVTATVGPLTFNQHVALLNPSLQRYVKRLYLDYSKSLWQPRPWSKLDAYIKATHEKAEKQYKFDDPMTDKEIKELAYGVIAYSAKWKSDMDWNVSYISHESGWLDIIGDKINKKTKLPNPPSRLSLGQGQVQIATASQDLKARGYNPDGLTIDDLLYFRLVNLDISICVMSSYVKALGRKNGTKKYNAGNLWRDGRSNQYYKDVLTIYRHRNQWAEPTQ